ncbi:NAD(P)-dependent alcohol dehydrogenase [Dactylosporangium sp. CA-092794]|uniref:NAD(P)-dependent alcohol dehydrogenase n=1 Tax=Dactylosporangium sp. CA-092794 TaxID=3239929 RepID=UPI003D9169A2
MRSPGAALSVESLVLDDLRPGEVLVRVVATGVCHTDVSCRAGTIPIATPVVLGHEGAGIVEAVGAGVPGLRPGDRVAMTFGSCGACRACTHRLPSYCDDAVALNLTGNRPDGTSAYRGAGVRSHYFGQSSFATHSVVPHRNLVPVPDDVDLGIVGPLGCGIQTGAGTVFTTLDLSPGATLVVFGAGAVGLAAVMAAAVREVGTVIVVDLHPARLELARELGATHVVNARDADPVAVVRELTGGGAGFSIEASGSPAALGPAVDCLGLRGVCAVAGAWGPASAPALNWRHIRTRAISIRGVSEGDAVPAELIPALLDLHRAGRFPFEALITYFDLPDIGSAFAAAESGAAIKPVVRMPA